MAGFCRNDVENLTLPNKNLTLLSNVKFLTSFQPITKKKNIRSFSSTFPILFWGFEKYLRHYSLYSYCSTNWQIKFKKAQLLSHALDFMVWHVSLWALSCLSWVFYWVFGYIVESEVEKLMHSLHQESVKKRVFLLLVTALTENIPNEKSLMEIWLR